MPNNELKAFIDREIPFTPALFARGHSVFAPILTWEWMDIPSSEEMQTQLAAAKRAGFGTVYILPMPAGFRPETMVTELEGYLGPDYFAAVKTAVETARSLGLRVWLYDEGGWPSGSACGKVPALLPDVCEQRLLRDDAGAAQIEKNPGRADIYSSRAAALFTEITHHAYAAALGETAAAVDAMFTDEPAGAPNAVSDEIFAAFSARFGYDLRDHFPAILSSGSLNETDRQARQDYFSLLETLFCETLSRYRAASNAHSWLLAGHLDRDHTADAGWRKGYGNVLAALRALDIPGVDAIAGQILSGGNRMDGAALDFYPRFASSAALQKGSPLALSESFAVYGNALSGDEMRYIVNYQLVRGIDLFNFMQMPSTVKKWYAFSERPIFHPAVPGFFAMDGLFKEIERACLFMGTGLHCADTALFYPAADLTGTDEERALAAKAFCAAGEALEREGADFDLTDLPTLLAGTVENGLLCCGAARYARVVLPEGCAVPADLRQKLTSLSLRPCRLISVDQTGFLHRTVRDANGDEHICVMNQSREKKSARVSVATAKRLYLADVRSGTFSPFANGGTIEFSGGQCAFLLASDSEIPVVHPYARLQTLPLLPVSAEKTAQFCLTAAGAALRQCRAPLQFAEDYTAQVGEAFSGEITLIYAFETDGNCALVLRAERLFHFAAVFVNGTRAGSLCAAPYELQVRKELTRKGENTLTVQLYNLPAAAFAAAPAERFFAPRYLGPYHARALEFEKEIAGLGLAGLTLFRAEM